MHLSAVGSDRRHRLKNGSCAHTQGEHMRKLISCTALGLAIAFVADTAAQTSSKDKPKTGADAAAQPSGKDKMPAGSIKLPIPDFEIPCDVSVWKDSFTIVKVTHDSDNNQ